ncbi:MAG: Asp-tRNA(Asn)/Glu-tRNA(Gln) amidotransferase subunit GatA, partial [Oscillospiraceae bacterium]|nr:Asp-tRNA(Asn)/Glu-tRNA(Gln) amidotransferase subunit GatA [Oscillospiraceae bacterium]
MELFKQTASTLNKMLVNKECSSAEITESVFSQIDKVEDRVKAYVTLTKETAMAQAKAVDEKIAKGEKIGKLSGIPIAIKDNICTKGVATTCSSKMLENFVPPYDATVMEKLNACDIVMTGKANMDEFAMGSSTENSYFKKTANPHDLERVPGGSSG